MYAEKPYSNPPKNAVGHHVVHRRSTKHIDVADTTTANRTKTFQVTTGPKSDVIGEKAAPNATIDGFKSELRPSG